MDDYQTYTCTVQSRDKLYVNRSDTELCFEIAAAYPNFSNGCFLSVDDVKRLREQLDTFLKDTEVTKEEELAAAWAAYREVQATALAAYKEATAPAEAAYKEVTAPAEAAYKEATAPAWAAYEKAVVKIKEKYKDD